MSKTRNFKSREAYDKWIAYDKMHVNPEPSHHPLKIEINGHEHKVCHICGSKSHHTHEHFG